ncbi:methyl-accepting chemotaxis protein [Salidesulfovibrio onnuriiensis]|uniref:methyl-accepting chemotaxis protein n=1 Tax=Salidesulfovibrio onnuriiensis TaxID=2583823 RepID=UPI0011CCDB85|nr:methyl-accepting chemotaxis protein [Salidesulfovibrio onnuriiensis]
MKFKDWSLKLKILIPIFSIVLLVLTVSSLVMTMKAQDMAITQAKEMAHDKAAAYSLDVANTMNLAMTVTRTLAATFDRSAAFMRIPDREDLDSILIQTLERHKELAGTWCAFLPDAFDGREEEYKDIYNGAYRNWYYRDNGKIAKSFDGTSVMVGHEWFDNPMSGDVETITEPYPYEAGGKTFWLSSTGHPIKKNGRNIGVVGVDFYLNDLQKTVLGIKPFETGYAFLVTSKGTIVAHPDKAIVAKNISDHLPAHHLNAAMKAIKYGERFTFTDVSDVNGEESYVAFAPITVGKTGTTWSLAVVVPMDKVREQADSFVIVSVVISVVAIAILFLVVLFIANIIIKPLRETMAAADEVANGNLDVQLHPKGKDETSLMQRSLNSMISTLKENIKGIEAKEAEANKQAAAAQEALQKAEEAMAKAEVATKEGMLTAAGRLEGVVTRVNEATGDIADRSEEIRSGTDIQMARIHEAATAMEEMNATVLEVARNAADAAQQSDQSRIKALEGADLVSDTVEAMANMQKLTMELRENMHKLGAQSEAIGQVMNVINDIADQTNLLALNAAIEAARAGEAGRGFAVVADEVRKLAEKTMGATKEVGENIQGIQHLAQLNVQGMDKAVEAINGATDVSNESGAKLKEIVSMAEEAAAQVQSIAAAAEEQSAASEQITRSVDEINAIAQENTERVSRSDKDIQGLADQAHVLSQLVEDLKADAQ